jgi:hypothetical protein
MLTDCCPTLMVPPPTLMLALPIALMTCDVVGVELVEIDFDLEFFRRAAPGVDLHHALDCEQTALHHPILDGPKVGQSEMRRAFDLITVDFADQARPLNRRHDIVRQADILLQTDRGLGESKVVIDAVPEGDPNERQAVERRRADDIDPRRGGEADFHGNGVIALHFLGRQPGRLGGDLQNDGRGIWVSLDVELAERNQPPDDEDQKAEQNNRAAGQPECQHALDHKSASGLIRPSATALIAASARVVACSLMRALLMWKSTVRFEQRSCWAICADVWPCATRVSTWI